MSSHSQELITHLAQKAGITIGGSNPWDIHIHDERFYDRVVKDGSLGFGESYMDGWWDAQQLDELFYRVLRSSVRDELKTVKAMWLLVTGRLLNKSKTKAFEIGEKHYDVGNILYETMLDKRMVYTCGYWKDADNVDDAQEAKLDLVCKKIGLKKGDRVLDIGCGWGSFLEYAAEKYGATGVGLTVSKEQKILAQKRLEQYDMEVVLEDYREYTAAEPFDHIISLGMIEHVGYKNYRAYMEMVARNLKDDGLFLLHTIGNHHSVKTTDPWIDKYIFPNSMLPSLAQLTTAVEDLFIVEDVHNFSAYYDKTLMAWHKNVFDNKKKLSDTYDERFFRMWHYYLLSFAGMFRARKAQLWQIVLSKQGVPGGYQRIS